MGRSKQGFVFSLDAFVAFSLILIGIQSIVIISSSPSGYWPSLLQAQFLAKDSLHAAQNTLLDDGRSVLGASSGDIVAGALTPSSELIQLTDRIVQRPYSYAYSYYDLNDQTWTQVYNASDPKYVGLSDPHINISFRRVAATSQQLLMEYSVPPVRPESPYCNVVCQGWSGDRPVGDRYQSTNNCTRTPCSAQSASAYQMGNLTFGLVRLTVWG